MENENLPATRKNNLFDKIKRVFTRGSELDAREEALNAREEALNSREEALNSKEESLNARANQLNARAAALSQKEKQVEATISLYKEQAHIAPETNPAKANTEKIISTRFQELQAEIQNLSTILDSPVEFSDAEKERLQFEVQQIKAQILAVVAVYKESLSPHELSAIQIGDKKVSLNALTEQLPKMLDFPDCSALYKQKDAILLEYRDLLEDLKACGVTLQIPSYYDLGLPNAKFRTTRNDVFLTESGKELRDMAFSSFVERYYNGIEGFKKSEYNPIGRNPLSYVKLRKDPASIKSTQLPDSPITEEISKTLEALGTFEPRDTSSEEER